ncbi:MAG: ferrous iron transport protein A [Gammaproteobacteria bacterium]|nr:MAG: ferrous iron transport protein A [Gammaproteobacteria bacterium]
MNAALSPDSKPTISVASDDVLRLDECQKGAQVRIIDLQQQTLFGAQDERVTLRLKELGFLPGAQLKVIGFGLLGSDPLAVQVNGTKFALRRAEAAKVRVELISGSH